MKSIILIILFTLNLIAVDNNQTKNTELIELSKQIEYLKKEIKSLKQVKNKPKNILINNQDEFIKILMQENRTVLKDTVGSVSDNIYLLEIILAIFTLFFSVVIILLEWKHNKNVNEKIETKNQTLINSLENFKKENDFNERFRVSNDKLDDKHNNLERQFNDLKRETIGNIENETKNIIDDLFKNEYNQIIYNQVKQRTNQFLFAEKDSIDLLESIAREMSTDIAKELKNKNVGLSIDNAFSKYKAIKLLTSNDDNKIKEGLQIVRQKNYKTIKPYLKNLRERLDGDKTKYDIIPILDNLIKT